jgi:hypothetical protein
MFSNLLKAAVGIVTTPVTLVADVITLGGALTDKEVPYTYSQCETIIDNLVKAVDPKN